MKRKNFLACKNIIFYSDLEKEVFFEFLKRIKSIVEIEKKIISYICILRAKEFQIKISELLLEFLTDLK